VWGKTSLERAKEKNLKKKKKKKKKNLISCPDVEIVKQNMQVLKDNVSRINNLTRARLVEVDVGRDAQKNDELQQIIDQSNTSISLVSKKLKEMEAANKELSSKDATARTRINMHATLQKKFAVMIRDFQEAQTQAKMSMEERMVREIRVVKPDVTGEEVARIMAQDDPSRIFQQEMLGDLDHQRARQNLLFITERHKDIITLEKSIRELHQLFVDMAALVRPLCDGFPSFFFVVDQRNL
jgi:syntaxin 1B/2/3